MIEAKVMSQMACHLGKMVVLLPSMRMDWKSLPETNFPEFIRLWPLEGHSQYGVISVGNVAKPVVA
jgi:hypothetical protein